jgi:hypothetical protein
MGGSTLGTVNTSFAIKELAIGSTNKFESYF